jgi:hypothetical protein
LSATVAAGVMSINRHHGGTTIDDCADCATAQAPPPFPASLIAGPWRVHVLAVFLSILPTNKFSNACSRSISSVS